MNFMPTVTDVPPPVISKFYNQLFLKAKAPVKNRRFFQNSFYSFSILIR